MFKMIWAAHGDLMSPHLLRMSSLIGSLLSEISMPSSWQGKMSDYAYFAFALYVYDSVHPSVTVNKKLQIIGAQYSKVDGHFSHGASHFFLFICIFYCFIASSHLSLHPLWPNFWLCAILIRWICMLLKLASFQHCPARTHGNCCHGEECFELIDLSIKIKFKIIPEQIIMIIRNK